MTTTNEPPFLRPLTVIHTDLAESEALIMRMAEAELQENPGSFAGLTPCVYFKMPYVRPCDPFGGLRHLILRIRESTGLRACYKGIVAIEATEWLGHEGEEYFTVLLKFLYDHRHIWQAALVLSGCAPARVQRFLSACVRIATPRVTEISLFDDDDALCRELRGAFLKNHAHISPAGASMLAGAMAGPELKAGRSLAFIERIAAEVIARCDDPQKVGAADIRGYLLDPCSTLTLMAGKILWDERGTLHENENLHLRG